MTFNVSFPTFFKIFCKNDATEKQYELLEFFYYNINLIITDSFVQHSFQLLDK